MNYCVGDVVRFIDVFGKNPVIGLILKIEYNCAEVSIYTVLSNSEICYADDTMIIEKL